VIQIVRYANRKFYNKDKAGYLSLLDLSELVYKGASVTVTCDRTGADLTTETLSRALYERLKQHRHTGEGVAMKPRVLEKLICCVPIKKTTPTTQKEREG